MQICLLCPPGRRLKENFSLLKILPLRGVRGVLLYQIIFFLNAKHPSGSPEGESNQINVKILLLTPSKGGLFSLLLKLIGNGEALTVVFRVFQFVYNGEGRIFHGGYAAAIFIEHRGVFANAVFAFAFAGSALVHFQSGT